VLYTVTGAAAVVGCATAGSLQLVDETMLNWGRMAVPWLSVRHFGGNANTAAFRAMENLVRPTYGTAAAAAAAAGTRDCTAVGRTAAVAAEAKAGAKEWYCGCCWHC